LKPCVYRNLFLSSGGPKYCEGSTSTASGHKHINC